MLYLLVGTAASNLR